jgi:probable phosphoglycerate mutase
MATTRLILLRHGETLWNLEQRYQGHLDSPLTDAGVLQSGALASRLAGYAFSALYSSDLGRALQTAEIIAKRTGHTLATDSRLRERHLGIFQGLSKREIRQKYPQEYGLYKSGGPDYAVPNGESATQACARLLDCLNELARRHAGESIVVVAHGGVLSALLIHTLGISSGAPRRFERHNGSWNLFVCRDEKWFLETWGDVSHLQTAKFTPRTEKA